jgi:hypothetical protein
MKSKREAEVSAPLAKPTPTSNNLASAGLSPLGGQPVDGLDKLRLPTPPTGAAETEADILSATQTGGLQKQSTPNAAPA